MSKAIIGNELALCRKIPKEIRDMYINGDNNHIRHASTSPNCEYLKILFAIYIMYLYPSKADDETFGMWCPFCRQRVRDWFIDHKHYFEHIAETECQT